MSDLPTPMPSEAFDGGTYVPRQDFTRLTGQMLKVFAVMCDGEWRTLWKIRVSIGGQFKTEASEAGISARLRDLRKAKYGAHTVERKRVARGLYEYRLTVRRG